MGFFLGLIVGFVIALLVAPQRGDVTREEVRQLSEELRRRAEELTERAKRMSEEAQTRSQRFMEEVRARDGGGEPSAS